nr:saccharopine dehydrogenase NADP-binding domain-containing protein [candidate division Zixibacteria bacterium]
MTGRLSFALIGEHIAYSRSPAVFEAIFRADGVEGSFRVHEVSAAAFAEEFPRLLRSGVHGLAVTIPHKERVAPFLDDLDPVARALGAVNSIAIADRLRGFNTDVAGFRFALENYRAVVAGRPALVLGCGGAARAVVYALHRHFGVPSIVITSRRAETLERTVERLRKGMAGLEITPAPAARLLPLDRPVGVVVNATPLGGGNHPRELP